MAWTKRELFSFARKCEYFALRLESLVSKKGGNLILVIANWSEHGVHPFPASILRKVFDYAQQRANEMGQEVRIVMEACLREEHGGDEDLFGVATVRPQESARPVALPILPCSMCMEPATQQCVVRYDYDKRLKRPSSVIEHGCNKHIESIKSHWA